MENEERLGWVLEMFETEPELFNQVYHLLNAGICEAVNGSMVVREPTSKTILNEQRKLVLEKDLDPNSPEREHMRMLGRPSRIMSRLLQRKLPTSKMDQEYLEEILVGFGKKLNP